MDHCICDPPYEAECHETRSRESLKNGRRVEDALPEINFAAITEEQRAAAAKHVVRVTRGWALIFCQIEAIQLWKVVLVAAGAKWHNGGVWVKGGKPRLSGDGPGVGIECIAMAWCGDGKRSWRGRWSPDGRMRGANGVWIVPHMADRIDHVDRFHPTQKPRRLMDSLIDEFTLEGQLICDPFCGAGSTGVSARRAGRRFIGWEMNEEYHQIACARIAGAEQVHFDTPRGEKEHQHEFNLAVVETINGGHEGQPSGGGGEAQGDPVGDGAAGLLPGGTGSGGGGLEGGERPAQPGAAAPLEPREE